jgi:retron-type reverse transcriptase
VGHELLIKLDIRDFFHSTRAERVENYFRKIGWNAEAAALLTRLCTYNGLLPQGAPTSPRLSNLVNVRLDARLSGVARWRKLAYSRYADDMAFSGTVKEGGDRINDFIYLTKQIVEEEGYILHTDKKLRIARRHNCQIVTGIVVNDKANLPRQTRRWLRAVEHRVRTGKSATLTPQQLEGWRALQSMVATQSQ